MKHVWLAVPIILIIALGLALFLNQPKVAEQGDSGYVDVGGDEYLDLDFISPDEEGIGELNPDDVSQYQIPKSISECDALPEGEKDWCYNQYAVYSGDESACGLSSGQSTRDDCYAQLAILNNEPELCDNVKYGFTECYAFAAIQNKDASLCEKGAYEKQQCLRAFAAKDYKMCAEGFDRLRCNDAITDNNADKCNEIRDYSGFCYYTIATDTNNSSLCNKAGETQSTCFFRIALELNNPAICENLTDSRDNCVAWIAFNTRNRDLCFEAGKETQSCLADIDGQ